MRLRLLVSGALLQPLSPRVRWRRAACQPPESGLGAQRCLLKRPREQGAQAWRSEAPRAPWHAYSSALPCIRTEVPLPSVVPVS